MIIDITTTTAPKSDQLNADDLIQKTMTIKVTKVTLTGGDQPVSINFEGDNGKPYKPGKSMRRALVNVWGSDGSKYIGRSMTIYRDDKVSFGGTEVGGIRISHMSHIEAPVTMALTESRAKRKPFRVMPLKVENVPEASQETIDAGNAASIQGVEAYTAWLKSLAPDVKKTIASRHSEWSKVAKKSDEDAAEDNLGGAEISV